MAIPEELNDRWHRSFRQDPTNENQSVVATFNANEFEVGAYDYIVLTYVAAGNGAGEIETVTYKTGGASGTTLATLTLTYDANDKLSTVTKS